MEDEYQENVNPEDLEDLFNKLKSAESQNTKLASALSSTYAEKKDQNFLHYQISTDELLERLEHFYRGDQKSEDEEGNVIWLPPQDDELATLNEYGVSVLMGVVTKYIEKGTFLGDYTERRIYEIITDIGKEIILYILCNSAKMGLTTHFKKTQFRLIVVTTVHMIENAYSRAKHGRTLEELNQSRIVGQFGEQNRSNPTMQHTRSSSAGPIKRLLGFS